MFSPNSINIRSQQIPVYALVQGVREGRIVYGNYSYRVSQTSASKYIESLILNIPSSPLYFDGTISPWRVIDGVKRLSCILDFVNNSFPLRGLEYVGIYDHCPFSGLPPFIQSRLMNSPVHCYVVNPGTPTDVVDNIGKRIKSKL